MSGERYDPKDRRGELERLRTESDRNRLDFLRTDLGACFTLVELAVTEYHNGHREASRQSALHAEDGYATVSRYLSDERHAKHISREQREELESGLAQLRAKLDEFNGMRGAGPFRPEGR